jgi:hypothetical protein
MAHESGINNWWQIRSNGTQIPFVLFVPVACASSSRASHWKTCSTRRIAKMERSLAREGPPPKEPVTPIIFQSGPYVDTMEQEVQCDLIGDPRLEISNLQNELASREQQLSSAMVSGLPLRLDP